MNLENDTERLKLIILSKNEKESKNNIFNQK